MSAARGGAARGGESRRRAVVKLGGTTLAEQRAVLQEVARTSRDMDLVVVHGGGKRVTEWLSRLGIEARFENGLRVTDDATLEVVVALLRGVINSELVAALRSLGADAVGVSGVDGGLVAGRRIAGLGRVVTATQVQPELLATLLAGGYLPVVAPVALDEDGALANVNADDVAAALAAALGVELLLMTDADGVRGADGRRIPALTGDEAETLIANGTISGGMVPKVRSALAALPGASQAVIADGSASEALRRALDDPAFGTRLRAAAGSALPARRAAPG